MKKKTLVIVAHPDDETIWMGGFLLNNYKKWDITIISLCRKNDKDRAFKFKKVCKILNAKCYMSDLEDEKLNDIYKEEVIKRIKKYSKKNYDYIFTHGKNGEYAHKRHIDINKAVTYMLNKKMILCKIFFLFSYIRNGKFCYPNKNSDKFINLNKNCLKKKKKLIKDIYGFNKNSFEYICSRNKEAFKILKIK